MSQKTDRVELVQALNRFRPMALAYAYAIVRDFHLAEDACQEAALLVAERWGSLPEGEHLDRWVKEVVRRKALELRRKSVRPWGSLLLLSDETLAGIEPHFRSTAAADGPGSDTRTLLKQCLDALPPRAHAVVLARYAERRSCEAIAGMTGGTVQGVYSLLKRARLALVACFDRRAAALKREVSP